MNAFIGIDYCSPSITVGVTFVPDTQWVKNHEVETLYLF